MNILQLFLISLCFQQIFSAPIKNRRNYGNFQEVKIQYPSHEIPILYPAHSINYEQFKSPYEEYIFGSDKFAGPDYSNQKNENREEIITPSTPQESSNGRLLQREEKKEESKRKESSNPIVNASYKDKTADAFIEHNSLHEEILNRGFKDNFNEKANRRTGHLKEAYKDDYSEEGEEKQNEQDKEKYKKNYEDIEKEGKKEKFLEKEGHKKGHKTKAYNNKFHRDEIHREHKFYDDDKDIKDQQEEKSEQIVKSKLNKDLDTYKEVFHPRYSATNHNLQYQQPFVFEPYIQDQNQDRSEQFEKKVKLNRQIKPKQVNINRQTKPKQVNRNRQTKSKHENYRKTTEQGKVVSHKNFQFTPQNPPVFKPAVSHEISTYLNKEKNNTNGKILSQNEPFLKPKTDSYGIPLEENRKRNILKKTQNLKSNNQTFRQTNSAPLNNLIRLVPVSASILVTDNLSNALNNKSKELDVKAPESIRRYNRRFY